MVSASELQIFIFFVTTLAMGIKPCRIIGESSVPSVEMAVVTFEELQSSDKASFIDGNRI